MRGQHDRAYPLVCVLLIYSAPMIRAEDPSTPLKFSGGDGSSLEKAVVILGATDESAGVGAEHTYLSLHFPGSAIIKQALLHQEGKAYDRVEIRTSVNTPAIVYFDITDFLGRF
jgi:hypothetical protein